MKIQQQMAREVKKRKSEATVDDSTSNSTSTSSSNTTPQADNQATDATTDVQVNTAPQMSSKEMLRFSLNCIYDVGLISSFNLAELVDMMSSKQCRIVRSQRSKLLNAIINLVVLHFRSRYAFLDTSFC